MILMQVSYPLVEGAKFDVSRYITHMRLARAASDGAIKKIYINTNIPGTGYNATGEPWPQQCVTGFLLFESYRDFEEKFKVAVVPLREDIKNVSELRAYTNFFLTTL